MLKTYTLYLRDAGPTTRFEPALCETDFDAAARARELLMLHPDCETVEVFFGQDCLFVVQRPSPSPATSSARQSRAARSPPD